MMVTRGTALAAWRAHLEEAIGVAEAAALVDPFETVDWSSLATKQDLERLATKDDLASLRGAVDVLRAESREAEERSNARLSAAMLGVSESMRKQTWAIIVGMPTLIVALFTLAGMLP